MMHGNPNIKTQFIPHRKHIASPLRSVLC